jgi:hypothetical protein
VFLSGFVILAYRGWNGRQALMPLDVVFVQQSLDPSTPFWGVSTPAGQFDVLRQFSGYLHTVVRVFVELFELAPFTAFPALTFTTSTIIWASCGWAICFAVKSIGGTASGVIAAAAFALLPASNIILLAQLNALQWPMLVSAVILIASNVEPRSRAGRVTYLIFLFTVASNAALAFIPIAMLGWRSLVGSNKRLVQQRLLAMCVPYVIQIITHVRQPFRRAEDLNPTAQLFQEVLYIPKMLLPGSLREGVSDALSVKATIILLVFTLGLLGTVVGACVLTRRAKSPQRRVSAELLIVGTLSGVISVVMNGNLNHQYLMIPLMCWWVTIILSIYTLIGSARVRHLGQLAAAFGVGVFIFSSITTWNKDIDDPFFSPPGLANLSVSLERAQASCAANMFGREDVSGTGLVLPCEIVVTLR